LKSSLYFHFILSSIIQLSFIASAFANTVSVVADPWCPFTCAPQLGMNGAMIDVLAEVFGKVGKGLVYKNLDWSNAIQETREGKFSAIAGALKSDAPDFIFPETPIGFQRSCLFIKKGSAEIKSIDGTALKGLKIGAVKDYKYGEPFDSVVPRMQESGGKPLRFVEGVNTTQKLFLDLKAGLIDVLVEDESVVSFLEALPSKPLKGIQFVKTVCQVKQPLFIAFSPKRPESAKLAAQLDKGLQRLSEAKKLAKIWKNYSIE